jgi:hypothetical protein
MVELVEDRDGDMGVTASSKASNDRACTKDFGMNGATWDIYNTSIVEIHTITKT